jgi:hypothetical protein
MTSPNEVFGKRTGDGCPVVEGVADVGFEPLQLAGEGGLVNRGGGRLLRRWWGRP